MDIMPRCQHVKTCCLALMLLIACDKSYQFDNPVPVGFEEALYMNGTFAFPGLKSHRVTRCTLELSCRNRCKRDRESSDLYCQCDQLCWIYGDCCVDYYSRCLGVDVADPDSVILRAVLAQLRSYYDFLRFYEATKWARLSSCQKVNEQYIQVVRACDKEPEVRSRFEKLIEKLNRSAGNESAFAGMSSADVVHECENLLTDDDYVTLPVSLTEDYTVHFYNVFCAICNGIDPYGTLAWSISRSIDTAKTSKKQTIIVSTFLGRRWCIQYRDDLLRKDGSVPSSSMKKANGVQSDDAASGAKTNSDYGLCKLTDSVSSDFSLCRRYLRPYIINEGGIMFKNQHCALCSETNVVISCLTNKCVCPETSRVCIIYAEAFPWDLVHGSSTLEKLPNLKDLFYFRDQTMVQLINETVVNIEAKTCAENKVFSRFYDKCVDVVCPDGASSTSGRCPDAMSCDRKNGTCDEGNAGKTIAESVPYPRGSTTVSLIFKIQRVTDDYGVEIGQNEYTVFQTNIDTNARLELPETKSPSTISNSKKPEQADETKTKVNPGIDDFIQFPLSLQNMKSIWINQISSMGSWNFTETFYEIWRNIYMNTDNVIKTKDVQFSLQTTESCSVTGANGGHRNSSSPICQQYIDVNFICNDSRSNNVIMSLAEKEIVPHVMASAHKNNYVMTDVRMTNADFGGYSQGEVTDFNTAGVCSSGRRAEKIAVKVTAGDNGTYVAYVNRFSAFPIDHFRFSLSVVTDETTRDVRLEGTAVVVVCKVNISTSNCSMVFYSSADIVEYNNHLIIAKQAKDLLGFLTTKAARAASLSDILKIFSESNNVSDIEVHPMGMYVMSHSGAYVCSDYSRNYSVRNETVVQVPHRFRSMSDSIPERIATVLAFAVSITCLVAVLLVYSLVPELRNTPGKIVMSMSGTLLLAQVMLFCAAYPKGLACSIYAATQHAAWLASSAWLTAMAVHLRHVLYNQLKNEAKSIFGFLAFLCWGLPTLLAGSCFTLDRIGLVDLEYDSGQKCWVNNIHFAIFAFGVPFFLLVAATFICGACIVRAIQKSSDFVHKATKDTHRVRGQLILCINIAFLMGLGWAIYFIAMLVDEEAVWIIFTLANGSQGLFVFLCYAAKRSVMRKLMQRWRHRQALYSDSTSSNDKSTWSKSKK